MEEIWKDIEGYEGIYQVSSFGRVRSLDRMVTKTARNTSYQIFQKGQIIHPSTNKHGYVLLSLYKDSVVEYKRLHRLVAETFIPNPNNLEQVNHIDGNKQNNHVENLEWCSRSANMVHAFEHGLLKSNNVIKKTPVNMYKDGKFIRSFDSVKEACSFINYSHADLCKFLSGKSRCKTLRGYTFSRK